MLATFNNEAVGPVIEIGISQSQPGGPAIISPPANTIWIKAIADTGASQTCVCAQAAGRAALPVIGKGNMQSASHTAAVNLFYGDLWIRGRVAAGSVTFAWPFRNRVFMELALPGTSHEALLGMDIFKEGMLTVLGTEGKTIFSW